jgi:hypothetical protein
MRQNKIAPVLSILILSILATPFLGGAKETVQPLPHALAPQSQVHTPPPVINKLHPMASQSAEGGTWRTDGTFSPTFMLRNTLGDVAMSVTPVLYMADGTEYDLPQVQLDPSGVAMINILTALQAAPPNIQAHISSFGSAGIQFQWPWPAVFAAVLNRDQVRSLVYQTHLEANAVFTHDPTAKKSAQVLESTWWKQEPDATGFLAITNTSLSPVAVTVKLTDGGASNSAMQQATLASHNTVWVDLTQIWTQLPSSTITGGIEIAYTGVQNAISVSGGLEDDAKGYSQMLHFAGSMQGQSAASITASSTAATTSSPSQPQTTTLDSTGIMMGTQEADMQFPQGTVFAPYMVLRNTTANPMPVQLAVNTMVGATPTDLALGSVTLAPFESRQVNMKPLLTAAGLGAYNGYINLRTTFTGGMTDLLEETGSIDPTFNYVFEVPAHLEETTGSRLFNYWNTNGDTDSMFTLWNYSSTAQDVVLTFYHQEGKYQLPVHLEPHASMTMSVGKLVRSGVPDASGNVIPANIVQGSAKISGLQSNHQQITVAVFAGTFNSRTGTCYYACNPCNCLEEVDCDPDSFSEGVSDVYGVGAWAVFQDDSEEDVSSEATWGSDYTSIATVASGGDTTGVALGTSNITAGFTSTGPGPGPDGYSCGTGCTENYAYGSSPATITPKILLGGCSGTNITNPPNGTQSAVIGQKIVLCATYTLPSGVTATSESWSPGGTYVGGYSPTTTNSTPTTATLNTDMTTFYWLTTSSSQTVTFSLNLSGGATSTATASAVFNIVGPTSVSVSIPPTLGTAQINNSYSPPLLQFGSNVIGNVFGIQFTASATEPSGYSPQFKWVQVITNDTVTETPTSGSNLTCYSTTSPSGHSGTFPALDTNYPFDTANPTQDSPVWGLATNRTEVQRTFQATMYLMWNSGVPNAIDVPLGSASWSFAVDASYNSGTSAWGLTGTNGGSSGTFASGTTYPTWSNEVTYSGESCH